MNQYVLLTGGKNNAGDYLIKNRAKLLFSKIRPDRALIDYDAWKPLTDEQLEVVNASQALILTGGPALQNNMYPGIYKLRDNLNEIKVPILTMGIGWKSISGDWSDTYNYPLSESTKKLLHLIDNSGYSSSVRDYHTLSALQRHGFNNFIMTGCPAYYELDNIGREVNTDFDIKKVAFSLGVSFIRSARMEANMKKVILSLKEKYAAEEFEVVFHHSLNKAKIKEVYGGAAHIEHVNRHIQFAQWLDSVNIKYVDISGSAENLINYYSGVDLHIGYRVHAHIFMNSMSKFSILIYEDSRGRATFNVINGIVLKGFIQYKKEYNLIEKILKKLGSKIDPFEDNIYLLEEILGNIDYQNKLSRPVMRVSRSMIDNNFKIMETFIQQLP